MTEKFVLDPGLQQFATERQWELLAAWDRHGVCSQAAAEMKVDARAFRLARQRVLKKAALRGYTPATPAYHGKTPVPEGFVLRGQSALVDKDGNLAQRWDKTKQEGMDPEAAVKLPDPKKLVKLSTMTDAEGRVICQWIAERPEDISRERAWRQFAEELSQPIARAEPVPPPTVPLEDLCAGYPVGDHHLGMLAWWRETGDSYDLKIGERMLDGAFNHLVNCTAGARYAVIAFLGDFLHYDNFETVTPTNRNLLDSDTRFPKMIWAAVRVMRAAIDKALRTHEQVHVIVEAGNHDLASSVFLALALSIAYEREPRVTVDTSPQHYHYYRFGRVLLGTHHGHGTKMQNLPLIMAADRPDDWGATRHRYWWTGHIHQSKVQPATSAQDYSGCVVESFRVLPPADAWAAQKGYRPHRDMKAIMFHREYGEVARHTVNPQMLEGSNGDTSGSS